MPSWLPILLVIFVTAIALSWASSPPATAMGRRFWIVSLMLCGSLAIAGTVWQQRRQLDKDAALAGSSMSPRGLPQDHDRPRVAELKSQIEALQSRVKELEARRRVRGIAAESAEGLATYLRQFGRRRVIVSCIPDDSEAYQYANQLINILKAANWEARGPEVTKIFGDVRAPGINVYVNPDDHSDTVERLFDGFGKFNIPYQSRVTPSQAIPDPETVELFIGTSPSERINAGAD